MRRLHPPKIYKLISSEVGTTLIKNLKILKSIPERIKATIKDPTMH